VLRALKATRLEGAQETEPEEREAEAMEAFETATAERI
jgi:hypothetical protein